ncbi:MAG: M3 family oligoendopeptidase [Candidatus Omnitrophota bacterium]
MTDKEFPRRFVPETAELSAWDWIEPLFQQLLEREIVSPPELEHWLLDHSELASCLSEERTRRYIAMTCDTGDAEKERRYLEFLETIDPLCKPCWHRLNERYLASPHRKALPRERYEVLDRAIQAAVDIFREENIPLQTEEAKLSQRYQKLCGAMTVPFNGEERTMPQMEKYLEELDRGLRQQAWERSSERRLQDREEMDDIFSQLIKLRHRIALQAGFSNFQDYAFLLYCRFDYTPQDCLRFHEAAEKWIVPILRRMGERRRQLLGVEKLRPWDLAVDPLGRPPLRPFEKAEQLGAGVGKIFARLNGDLSLQFEEMKRRNELDLESRKGKAPGGYLSTLEEVRRPFVFMNAAGLQRDVETLLHESGHAFHALAAREEPILAYRDAPLEFAEVASMSMELFGSDSFDVFYPEAETARAKRNLLEGIVKVLPWIARIDAFQHWLYAHPEHSAEERRQYWLELETRFGQEVDWEGCETAREYSWQKQLHLFCVPFYYIEYGIAQLGALQLRRRFRQDPSGALKQYRSALSLGGSRPLPRLFEAAGAVFDFSEATIRPLALELEKELNALSE